ncbi:transcriptional regulator, AraC family [Emticicia oligotrophica DSM 17448]|uniref:Transcriptional regulator, AraC family n=1 Tax=Emticicia oligotrophica (strain DSM 17448 / CIP 109782 / MTCC 6937 / GPTSA100-15) TaxID=929562 RepID=A0ABM5MZU5_EMTOG|nr:MULTISPECIES: AraC family transcriptional regulator [Emticicia]AFK02740.1 transcriptional regulator, AraC family [Emticicia oligotrophica DSM 17448]
MNRSKEIPKLNPSQFDNYLFGSWKPKVSDLYEQFHIERIENYKSFLKLPVLPHRRSVYFFLFVTKGFAIRSKGLTEYKVEANTFFGLSSDQITSLEAISDDVEGFYCHFQPEFFNQSLLNIDLENDFPFFQITSEPLIQLIDNQRIIDLLEILISEKLRNEANRAEIIALYLTAFLKEIKEFYSQTRKSLNNAASNLTQRYKSLLSENIYDKKTVTEFAEMLAVSPNHLHKCVKTTTGKSAHELLEEMRILEAKVLLKQTPLRIADIAFKIGGFEPSDFSRFFKSKTGISPKEYRNLQS